MIDTVTKNFDNNIDKTLSVTEEDTKIVLTTNPIELDISDDENNVDNDDLDDNLEDLERRRDELSRRLYENISRLPRDEQNMFPLVSVDSNINQASNIPLNNGDKGQLKIFLMKLE